MTDEGKSPRQQAREAREARLAAALRRNLRRRKSVPLPEEAPAAPEEA